MDYALRLKREFPGENLIVAGYCHDVMCYIPSRRVLREGGYEAVENTIYYGQPGPFAETVGAYVISLSVAALALLFFQRIGPDQDWRTWLAWTVVLGLPATIGGAAGRLAV